MKNLKPLISYVNKNKTKHMQYMLSNNANHNIIQLYDAIASEQFDSEAKAEKHFFKDSPYRHEYFTRLKRQLTEKLNDLILLIDFSKSPYQNSASGFNYCYKNVAVISIWFNSTRKSSHIIKMAEKTLKVALHHGYTEQALVAARFCYFHFMATGNIKKGNLYFNILQNQIEILQNEVFVEDRFFYLRTRVLNSQKKLTPSEKKSVEEDYIKISEIERKYDSNRINTYAPLFKIRALENTRSYIELVELCESIINSENLEKTPKTIINSAFLFLSNTLIQLGKYEKANNYLMNKISTTTQSEVNWQTFQYYLFLLKMRTGEYNEASTIYSNVLKSKGFSRQPKTLIEKWHVAEAYLAFLLKIKLVDPNPKIPRFSLKRFIEKVPNQRKDSGGYRVGIWIVQIIHYLIDKDHNAIIDREDALKTFTSKYLKDDYSFRMYCFVKMLTIIPKSNFHQVLTSANLKESGLIKRLKENPLSKAEQGEDIEIIPFERLWEIVLANL